MKTSYDTDDAPNIHTERYAASYQFPTDILYKSSKYFRKDKKTFALNESERVVKPAPNDNLFK